MSQRACAVLKLILLMVKNLTIGAGTNSWTVFVVAVLISFYCLFLVYFIITFVSCSLQSLLIFFLCLRFC